MEATRRLRRLSAPPPEPQLSSDDIGVDGGCLCLSVQLGLAFMGGD